MEVFPAGYKYCHENVISLHRIETMDFNLVVSLAIECGSIHLNLESIHIYIYAYIHIYYDLCQFLFCIS